MRPRGFTLLEVLVAITVMGLIMTTAFGAVRLASRSWEAGVTRSGETAELRLIYDFLRRELHQLVALSWPDNKRHPAGFGGARDELRFVAPAPLQRSGVGLYQFLLRAEQEGGTVRLVLYYEPLLPGEEKFTVSSSSAELVLARGLESVDIEYYGARRRGEKPRWRRIWGEGTEHAPEVVRIVPRGQEEGRAWPELLIRPGVRLGA